MNKKDYDNAKKYIALLNQIVDGNKPGPGEPTADPDVRKYSMKTDAAHKVSNHFRVREFSCPGADDVLISSRLLEMLEAIRTAAGNAIHITSGYRTKAHNDSIPGHSDHSQHLYGKAADFYIDAHSIEQTRALVLDVVNKQFDGIGGVGTSYPYHVHVDSRSSRARW